MIRQCEVRQGNAVAVKASITIWSVSEKAIGKFTGNKANKRTTKPKDQQRKANSTLTIGTSDRQRVQDRGLRRLEMA